MQTAHEVVRELKQRGWTFATCESLTAGLLAATIAEVPGASAVLRGGLITYATDSKRSLAGVDARLLQEHGPVSAETASAMAEGAAKALGSDLAVSLTGVAGPNMQDGHPVGEVFMGITLHSETSVVQKNFSGSRNEIRSAAVKSALEEVKNILEAE